MITSYQQTKDKVGSGRNITRIHERSFQRGSLMFIEGECSTEMFIIRSGKVRILKQEGDKTIELAILGTGSVLGELSLLDHQPRSATAQVIEDLNATVIDETLFNHTMKVIPSWLANIIQVVVRRLRDTMKRTSDSIVGKSVAGVIKILLLLYSQEKPADNGEKKVYLCQAKEAIASIIGIGDVETEKVLLHLILKEMMFIRKDDAGREYIVMANPGILQLYMNYLRTQQRGMKMQGEDLSENAIKLMQILISAGEKGGKQIKPGVVKVGMQQIEIELQRQGIGKYVDFDALDALVESKIIFQEQDAVKTSYQTHKRTTIMFNIGTVQKIITLHIWLARFKEDVQF